MRHFLPVLAIALLVLSVPSCGNDELEALGLEPGDTIKLADHDGNSPLTVKFEDAPASTSGLETTETVGVTFTADIDIDSLSSPAAFEAIQGQEFVEVEIRFVNTKRDEKPFEMTPIDINVEGLKRHVDRQSIPFPLEEIAMIIFLVDRKEIAWYPARGK